jgi:hypothetical protein
MVRFSKGVGVLKVAQRRTIKFYNATNAHVMRKRAHNFSLFKQNAHTIII